MNNIQWIKDLVLAEQEMEESGMIDMTAGFDSEKILTEETVQFLQDMKSAFVEAASAFNQLKGSTLGNVKIYGISRTRADFMLFRNGHKMIFSMARPGEIQVHRGHLQSTFIPGSKSQEPTTPKNEAPESLKSEWGPFGDLSWTFKDQPVKLESMVRYYLTQFVKESTK